MLGCTRPPCSRCICSSGYDGDGHTCTPAAPPPPPPTPAVMSGNHAPTVVTAPSSHDASAGSDDPRQQGFFSLQASAGVTYTITVTLGDLSDSVLEVWTGPRNHPTFVSRNDDAVSMCARMLSVLGHYVCVCVRCALCCVSTLAHNSH